jgi:hypothetical protein
VTITQDGGVELDDETLAAVAELARENNIAISQALERILRAALRQLKDLKGDAHV